MSLKFGKYKGKTFEYIYRVDKGYCSWFVNNCSRGKDFKKFILERGLFSREGITGKATTATDLAKKISLDPLVIEMLGDLLTAEELATEELATEELATEELATEEQWDFNEGLTADEKEFFCSSRKHIAIPRKNITAQLYGQFVDFYTRYRISRLIGIPFVDNSVETVIKKEVKGYEIIKEAYDELNGRTLQREELTHSNILKCAVASSLSFGSKKDVAALKKKLNLSNEIVERVDEFILDVVLAHETQSNTTGETQSNTTGEMQSNTTGETQSNTTGVLLNPRLTSKMVSAYADITTSDGVIDIKTGCDNIAYYLSQLMIYAVLFRRKFGTPVNYITIFNPTIDAHTTTIHLSQEKVDLFEEYLKGLKLL